MNKNKQFILLGIILSKVCVGQAILEQYIQEGFQKNQSIQQQELTLEKSMYALKEAKSLSLKPFGKTPFKMLIQQKLILTFWSIEI